MNLSVILANLGKGTAKSEHLLLYDLQETEKTIISTIATGDTMRALMQSAKKRMCIDVPGNGIMMAIPIKSVSGGKKLSYFIDGQLLGGKMPNMNFENELIIVILNEGYSEMIMEAARSSGASGGTVIHAKGTGKEKAEAFLGVSLAEEKDILYILASSNTKSEIMKKINQDCGSETPAGAVSFSVPVSEVVGIRKFTE